ncbi:hypothetical protein HPULCUR_004927 [Helicostylum pulchrum]|uniref:Uncharacterized protein n=1 Tax=Helicostylum pulchrum TaxID=562976 RepID=A0ABP9XXT1_9FUNG
MRFSTTTTTTTGTTASTMAHPATPSLSTIKKVLFNLVSKLPHHHSNQHHSNNQYQQPRQPTMIRNNAHTIIKVTKKTALTKEKDINQDVRNYYRETSKKRQLEEADCSNKKMDSERERRHKTVKQYQQTQESHNSHHHWIEHSNATIENKSAQQPKWVNTHGYIRDTRTNSNYLRMTALSNASNNNIIMNKEKPSTKKRTDQFIWGKQSPLRHAL